MGLKKDEIQGLAFSGYADWPAARLRLLQITDVQGARAWLGSELQRMTWGSEDRAQAKAASHCRNLAFTYRGLQALGLPEAALAGFERAFREGMAEPQRSQLLGDAPGGRSDPARWRWGGPQTPGVHLLQLLYARDEAAADILCEAEAKATSGFLTEIMPAKAVRLAPDGKEHFGFADGLSQPAFHEVNAPAGGGYDARRLATGELLLGHPDSLGNLSLGPVVDPAAKGADLLPATADGLGDFAINGAYLVARQMRQDVAGFQSMIKAVAQSPAVTTLLPDHTPQEREAWAGSRVVGRWQSGCPVVQSPDRDDPQFSGRNAFFFESTDPRGRLCPFGSHIRRANPRDSVFEPWRETNGRDAARTMGDNDRRRILRRGRAFGARYGADTAEAERGLMFLALGASIERQFEFVQHSWVLNPNFAGLADETDPLVGGPDTDFTLQAAPVAHRLSGVATQVWTEAGGYFFLPSRSALKFLAAQ